MPSTLPAYIPSSEKQARERRAEHLAVIEGQGISRDVAISVRNTLVRLRPTYTGTAVDWSEVESAAYLAAAEALLTWDPARAKFSTHIICRVRFAVLEAVRQQDHLSRGERAQANAAQERTGALPGWAAPPPSLDDTFFHGEFAPFAPLTWREALPDPEADTARDGLRRVEAAAVREAVRLLPREWRRVVQPYFFEDLTLTEIGKRLGISLSRARHLCQAGLAWLREELAELDPLAEAA